MCGEIFKGQYTDQLKSRPRSDRNRAGKENEARPQSVADKITNSWHAVLIGEHKALRLSLEAKV